MNVIALSSEYWANEDKKSRLIAEVQSCAFEAQKLLKGLSPNVTIIVKPNLTHFSAEKKVGGSAYDHELVDFTFDPAADYENSTFKKHLKEAIFHELSHALYYKNFPRENSQLYWTISEGLGNVFDIVYAEGEHFAGGERTLEEKKDWLSKNLTSTTRSPNPPIEWSGMMYETGTWIVESAIKNSSKNVIDLHRLSPEEILQLSRL